MGYYTVDIWGNLTQKGACDNVVCPTHTMSDSFTTTANGNNQFVGYSYDTSGNLQNDQLGHAFNYDAENRPYSAGGVTYYYDGEGERVAKSTGKLYLFWTGSAPVVETDANGTMTAEYVFFDGKRVAMRKADSSVHYYFADQIGSANVVTNATGAMPPEQDIEYHPYGEQQVYADTLGQQYKFTGKEHDPETNNDYFGARYYSSAMGRFLTPDWAATPVPIPYAVMGNPQTLNLYSYVENNPITGTDPDGHGMGLNGPGQGDCDGKGAACDDAQTDRKAAEAAKAAKEKPALTEINTKPPQPLPPPMAELKTDINGHTTTLLATDNKDKLTVTTIETSNTVDHRAQPGAGDPYTTHNVVGQSDRHAGERAYGPAGAFIDTGDSRQRHIHGGGSSLKQHAFDPQQPLTPTFGCTRVDTIRMLSTWGTRSPTFSKPTHKC